ncbi:hypothetical protein D3C80_666880 [compost metagenome]
MPSWRQKDEAHAPPDRIATFVLIVPCSVTTAESLPPSISIPRAAQFWCTELPSLMIARATAGAALAGSAVPSVGENTPPFHERPVAFPRSPAATLSSICVVTPTVLAKSRHLAQPAISSSLSLR